MSIDVPARRQRWPALAAWALGWAGMFALDDRLDLANKALVLVLSAALAAPWSGPWTSLLASAAAVLAFNFAFVPPRGRFAVDLHQHALLLATLLAVSWIVALLMTRLRRLAAQATRACAALGPAAPPGRRPACRRRARGASGGAAAAARRAGRRTGHAAAARGRGGRHGHAPTKPPACACACSDGRAMGPGSGRHEEQPAWYLPLRGRQGTHGAALLRLADAADRQADVLAHAQALCDQLGAALERAAALQAAGSAREQAQAQALRNTLLSAIAHDHRTPLATILGAASALHDQGERLSAPQRQRLAATIVDEAEQLTRLTDNTLQLARLGAVGRSAAARLGIGGGNGRHGAAPRAPARPRPAHACARRAAAAAAALQCGADGAGAGQPGGQRVEARRRRHAGGTAGAAHRRAAADRRARPRPGRAAGAARAHLRPLPPRRTRRHAVPVSAWRCAARWPRRMAAS